MKFPYHLVEQEESFHKVRFCKKFAKKRTNFICIIVISAVLLTFFILNLKKSKNIETQNKELYFEKMVYSHSYKNISQKKEKNNSDIKVNKAKEQHQKKQSQNNIHIKDDFYNDLSPYTEYELYYPDDNDLIPSDMSVEKCKQYSFSDTSLNFVPDMEQSVINDPFDYVHQNPERPLIPRNFHQDIEGIHFLEISPGVIIPHNFSGIKTQRVVKFANHSINVTTFDSGNVKEHFVWLPPFDWKVPHGLTKHQLDLFFKQPENHWHFDDCKMWSINVIWEVKNGISKLSEHGNKCTNHNYTNNLNFCEWPKTLSNSQKPKLKGDVLAFGGHYIEIFQHFFDNGISHMAAASFALGLNRIHNISLFSSGCGGTCEGIMSKMGFRDVQGCKNVNTEISAENLILIPTMRVLHPYYFEFFRYNMDKKPSKMTIQEKIEKYKYLFSVDNVTEDDVDQKDKIIILPRGHGSGGNARIIYNIDAVQQSLKEIHGEKNVVVYRKSDSHRIKSIDDMRFIHYLTKEVLDLLK